MSLEQAFITSILEAPEDTTNRLIFADWLEEHGDPRSELIRREVEAAGILGWGNIHGILSAQRFYRKIDERVVRQAAASLPKPEVLRPVLEECEEHILVLHPGFNLRVIRGHAESNFIADTTHHLLMADQSWYLDENEPLGFIEYPAHYILFPKQPLPLYHRTWKEQVKKYGKSFRPPVGDYLRVLGASELANVLLLHEQDTGLRLLRDCLLRCREGHGVDQHVCVGDFNNTGLNVYCYGDDERHFGYGLATATDLTLPPS